MGKVRETKNDLRKGNPVASVKFEAAIGLQEIVTNSIEEHDEIAEKYTVGEEDEPAPHVRVMHPNRNLDKQQSKSSGKKSLITNQSINTKTDTLTSEPTNVAAEELPDILTKEQLSILAAHTDEISLSIYLATHQTSGEKNDQRNFIAFKNNLQTLASHLKQKGLDQNKIEDLLKPAHDLLGDDQFWSNQSKGLAVFLSNNEMKYMRLPFSPKEETFINSSYYLSPLIPLITNKEYFYLLVLSKKQAKLFRADAFGMSIIPLGEMPDGIEDVVHLEDKEDQKLFRTDSNSAGHGASFHGMGAGKPDEKANIAMYFDEVDKTIWKAILSTETAPLLLAGVDYLIPIYKSVAKYNFIWDDSIAGNHEHEDTPSLYQHALEKMQPFFKKRDEKALEMYGNNSATALTSDIAVNVIPAAHYSQVAHLFVQKNEHIWGTFNEKDNVLEIHESQQEGDECLIDKSVISTILHGGEVHVVDKDTMPGSGTIAALMRY